MSEQFWKTATRPRTEESLLSSTTDSQRALDDAARGKVQREPEATFRYTEMRPALPNQDGSIEHSDPKVVTNMRPPKVADEPVVHRLPPALEAAALDNYATQVRVAQSVLPDFNEVMMQPDVPLGQDAAYIIQTELPNGPLVGYWLGKHRQDCERLNRMTHRERKTWLIQKSAEIATDPAAGLDTADYSTYRRIRNAQVKNLYR